MAFLINGNTAIPKSNTNNVTVLQINGNTVWTGQRTKIPNLPNNFVEGDAIIYNDQIHIVDKYRHYKFNGTSWERDQDYPGNNNGMQLVVLTESDSSKTIHAIGTRQYLSNSPVHYRYKNGFWTKLDDFPYNSNTDPYYASSEGENSLIVALENNNKIIVYQATQTSAPGAVYYSIVRIYDPLTNSWTDKSLNVPVSGSRGITFDNKVFLATSGERGSTKNKVAKINPTYLTYSDARNYYSYENLPYNFKNGSMVIYDGKLHLLGGTELVYNEYSQEYEEVPTKNHYYRDSSGQWHQASVLPYAFAEGGAVVYEGEIVLIGGKNGPKGIMQWNGSDWI